MNCGCGCCFSCCCCWNKICKHKMARNRISGRLEFDHLSPSQPSLKGSRVPPGHILVNSKFQGTSLIKQFQTTDIKPIVQDGLGIVDFYPLCTIAVIWLPEELLVSGSVSIKQKLCKLAKGSCNGMILAHLTQLSKQYFKELQDFSALELNIPVVPVNSTTAMIKILTQLVYNQGHQNPILKNKIGVNLDDALIVTLRSFPGVGEKKVVQLLQRYSSLYEIEKASLEDIESVVGGSAAINIRRFLDCNKDKITPKR